MPLTFMRCQPDHLKYIVPQDNAWNDYHVMTSPMYRGVITDHWALSAWDGLHCLAAAGIVTIYPGRAQSWAVISKDIGSNFLQLTRKVRAALDLHPAQRIETVVNCGFQEGHRWAKLIGMECEAPLMRKHGIHGQDEALYAKVK